jgi:hypothetical protein
MTIYVFTNNASSTLASGIAPGDATCTLNASDGALFPTISAGHAAIAAIEDVSGNKEIVHITARSGDILTITRAQDGTSARTFASGSRVELRVTAELLNALLQKNGGDVLAGTTTVSGVIDLGAGGSIQGGEFTGKVRSAAGVTAGEIHVSGGQPFSGSDKILTAANLGSALPAGIGVVHEFMVMLWFGASIDIPTGYVLCDGTHSTPNLTDKFVLGKTGSSVLPTSGGATSVNSGTSVTGASAAAHVLTTAELPVHQHNIKYITFGVQGGSQLVTGQPIGTGGLTGHTENAGSATGHTHTLTDPGHHHTVATLPPYFAMFYIMKDGT